MSEETGIVERVAAVLTAAGFSNAEGSGPRASGPEFLVSGGVYASVTVNWGPSSPEDHEFLTGCAAALRAARYEVDEHTSYLTVRVPAGRTE